MPPSLLYSQSKCEILRNCGKIIEDGAQVSGRDERVPPGCDDGAGCLERDERVPPGCDDGAGCLGRAERIPPWEAAGSAMPPWATANAEGMQVILFFPIVFRLYFLEPWNAFYGAAPLLSPKSQLSPTFQT